MQTGAVGTAGQKFLVGKEKETGRVVLERGLISEGARGFRIGHRLHWGILVVVNEDTSPGRAKPDAAPVVLVDVPRGGGGRLHDSRVAERTVGLRFDAGEGIGFRDPEPPGYIA